MGRFRDMHRVAGERYSTIGDVAEEHLLNDDLIAWAIDRNPHVSRSDWEQMVDDWVGGDMTCIQERNSIWNGRLQKRTWVPGIFEAR